MKRFFRAFILSFSFYIFLTLVCGAVITVVTIPTVGRFVAAPLCEGRVDSDSTSWSQPNGEFGTRVDYFCVAENGERTPISSGQLLARAALYYVGFMTVLVWPLLFLLSFAFGGRRLQAGRTIYIKTNAS